MDDAAAMCCIERIGDLGTDGKCAAERHRASFEGPRESFPLEVLHNEEGHAVRLPDIVDRADIGMADTGNRASFPLKTVQAALIC